MIYMQSSLYKPIYRQDRLTLIFLMMARAMTLLSSSGSFASASVIINTIDLGIKKNKFDAEVNFLCVKPQRSNRK